MRGYILIDGNSVAYAATAMKKLTVGQQEVQGVFGMLRTLRAIAGTYPMLKPVILWDGASWRKKELEGYKGSRDKVESEDKPLSKADIEQQQIRDSLKSQKKLMMLGFQCLGVHQVFAVNLEADDLAGLLVRRWNRDGNKIILITGDEDWIQLVQENVSWRDHRSDKKCSIQTLEEFKGVKSGRLFLEVKALMGDTSDEISGVGGIGEKGAVELSQTYGSVASFLNQWNDGSLATAKVPKKFRDFAESTEKQAIFTRNMRLMDLASPSIPKPEGLRVMTDPPDLAKFEKFCKSLCFQSILTDVPGWAQPFTQRSSL